MQKSCQGWSVRDVMVGVLHNPQQLQLNMAHRFYHIPAKLLGCNPEQISQIALYQSKRYFNKVESGVNWCGVVEHFCLIPRGEIVEIPARKNPDELYFRFEVKEFVHLPRRIRAVGVGPGVYMLTNRFLLENSLFVPELFIRTQQQYDLYHMLYQASRNTLRNGGAQRIACGNHNYLLVSGWVIGVYTQDGRYEQRDLREFYIKPYDFLTKMQEITGM